MAVELFALKYMTRFACVGAACEDNCCQRWSVVVDQPHHDRLRGKMSSPAERAEFEAKVRRLEGPPRAHKYALMVLREDKTCSFLADGLCSIHGRYGEELLPDVCATYPRSLTRIGERVELAGRPSCPEVARQILVEEDGLDLVSAEPPATPYRFIATTIDAKKSKDPYEANFTAVRGLVASLLAERRHPVASRLFFVAYFADKSRDILCRGEKRFDAEGLQELGSSLEEPATLATLHRSLGRALVDPRFGLSVVREMLGLPARLVPAALTELIAEVDAALAAHGASLAADPASLQHALAKLPPLAPDLAARLDVLVERYARHDVMRVAFAKEPSFIGFYHALLLRVATLRVLVGTLARTRPGVDASALDALGARAVYLLTRTLEHNELLMKEVQRALEAHGMTLENAVSLIRV